MAFIDNIYTLKEKEEMQAYYNTLVLSLEESSNKLIDGISNNTKFSYTRIGDIEGRFILKDFFPQYMEETKNDMWWCGINKNNMPLVKGFVDAIINSDIVGVQEPWGMDRWHFWGSTYVALQKHLLIGIKSWHSVHAIYKVAADGRLFNSFKGKPVVLIGAKAELFRNYFWRLPELKAKYPDLGLEQLNIVDTIRTVDLPGCAVDHLQETMTKIRQTYKKGQIYLFSCGALSKFLAWQVAEENNCISLDVGNIFESIMNLANKRPYMERFLDFSHPYYNFELGNHMQVTNIIKKI